MPKISIIVPVYNVEKYICKCIDSILDQTFTDFELILVDDGSPDNCDKICDEYAKKDKRIIVVHKKNGGLSDARNAGIDIATGEFIGFVDSDDYIAKDMYEVLYNDIIKENADMSICGLYNCYGEKKVAQARCPIRKVCTSLEIIEEVLSGKNVGVIACNKLYKKYLFENVRYPIGHIIEDAFIILDLLSKTKKVVINSIPKYYYVRTANSITMSQFSEKYYDFIYAEEKNLNMIKHKYPILLEVGEYRYWWAHFTLLNRLAADTNENQREYASTKNFVKNVVRKNYFSIIFNKYQSWGKIIAFTLIAISADLYMKIYHYWFYRNRNYK